MDELFSDFTNVEIYDIGIFTLAYNKHLQTLDKVLTPLWEHNFCLKASKCHWLQNKTPWLGHIISKDGIMPLTLKIEPILQLSLPQRITQPRSLIGMVNFYCSFWKKCAHIMAPLTACCVKSSHHSSSTSKAPITLLQTRSHAYPVRRKRDCCWLYNSWPHHCQLWNSQFHHLHLLNQMIRTQILSINTETLTILTTPTAT